MFKKLISSVLRISRFTHVPRSVSIMHHNNKNTYEEAIHILNKVQTNRKSLSASNHSSRQKLDLVEKYLIRGGINRNDFNKLPVIHVSGTKGKGSTCAFCESILRHNGYKTGFFCSPHLIEVRERIMINGLPISKETFAKYFWEIFENLDSNKENDEDLPFYFQLLFIIAVRTFIKENVDVAIIEVGIGGEYDPTNIVINVPVAGITSLGFDHTSVLGKTIESIAWNKAGIMKKGSKVFTVPQPISAFEVLHRRSIEKECSLMIVSNEFNLKCIQKFPISIQTNINLAIKMAEEWLISRPKQNNSNLDINLLKNAIEDCKWPGRYEIQDRGNLCFYIDGAHTTESIEICIKWYLDAIRDKDRTRGLIFNLTGGRPCENFFTILKKCNFHHVIFVPNIAGTSTEKPGDQLNICHMYKQKWLNNSLGNENVEVLSSVKEAVDYLSEKKRCDVLVTGSLHLVGATLSLLNPDLSGNLKDGI